MFAIFAGGELFGVPGLILGIPVAALLKVLLRYFVQPYVVQIQSQADAANVHVDVVVEPPPVQPETVVVTVNPLNQH
jgi:hypothetical protein